jgi:hypothetical protein
VLAEGFLVKGSGDGGIGLGEGKRDAIGHTLNSSLNAVGATGGNCGGKWGWKLQDCGRKRDAER